MDINIIKQPPVLSFSGNDLDFLVQLVPFNQPSNANYSLQVTVEVDSIYFAGVYQAINSASYFFQEDGSVRFDVKSIIDACLSYYLPQLSSRNIQVAQNQFINWRIRLSVADSNRQVKQPFYLERTFVTYKGGVAYQFTNERFLQNIELNKQFLGNLVQPQKVYTSQDVFLYHILRPADNMNNANCRLRCRMLITGNDGNVYTRSIIDQSFDNVYLNELLVLPIGYNRQNAGNALPAGVLPVKYTVKLFYTNPAEDDIELASADFEVEHRPAYNTHTLYYYNSLGALQVVTFRGQAEYEADYVRQRADRVTLANYFDFGNPMPQTITANPLERHTTKAATGFVSKQDLNNLRHLLLSKQVYELRNEQLVPVTIVNNNIKLYTNRDTLFSLQIEWEDAFQTSFYTAPYTLHSSFTCPAVKSAFARQISNTTIEVAWCLVDNYDLLQLQILNQLNQAEEHTLRGNAGIKQITLSAQSLQNPNNQTSVPLTVRMRTVCGDSSFGPWESVDVDIRFSTDPVTVDDTFEIPAGLVNPITLTPSVLANDYDPDGDDFEAVAVNNQATTQGGVVSINNEGIVTYRPVNAVFSGLDQYVYRIQKTGGGPQIQGTINFLVQVNNLGVYVGIAIRNSRADIAGPLTTVNGEVWLSFFSDAQGQQPLNLTGQNLTVNIRKLTTFFLQGTTNVLDYGIVVTGTQMQIYSGVLRRQNFTNPVNDFNFQIVFSVQPGTAYIAL